MKSLMCATRWPSHSTITPAMPAQSLDHSACTREVARGVTLHLRMQCHTALQQVTHVDPRTSTAPLRTHTCPAWQAYLSHPASASHLMYIVPISPIPMSLITGCSSMGMHSNIPLANSGINAKHLQVSTRFFVLTCCVMFCNLPSLH